MYIERLFFGKNLVIIKKRDERITKKLSAISSFCGLLSIYKHKKKIYILKSKWLYDRVAHLSKCRAVSLIYTSCANGLDDP